MRPGWKSPARRSKQEVCVARMAGQCCARRIPPACFPIVKARPCEACAVERRRPLTSDAAPRKVRRGWPDGARTAGLRSLPQANAKSQAFRRPSDDMIYEGEVLFQ